MDVQKEYIAVREAQRLGIPVFAMVDTCCDPSDIDYVIPSNDDATQSIELILGEIVAAVKQGLMERKMEKANTGADSLKDDDEEVDVEEESKREAKALVEDEDEE